MFSTRAQSTTGESSLADLTTRATQAAGWRFAGTGVGAVARFGVGILLARLLPPTDFGVVALAMVVVGFAQPLGDFGIGSAVIQRSTLTERQVRVAFTLSAVLGILISAVLIVTAPSMAALTRDARVAPVLQVLALTFALQGIAVVASALLRRQLEFKQLFFIDTFSYLTGYGAIAMTMAFAGWGLWSLVAAALAQTVISTIVTLVIVRHSMRPLFAPHEARALLHFGLGSGANSWVNYFAVNGDNFVVGRMLGAADLGLYGRAYNLMNLPYTYAASVMSGVLFPAFAQIQAEPARLRRAYLTLTQLTALIAAPAMGLLAIVAPYLVSSLYGPKWAGVVAPLQILCAAGYFRALYHVGGIVAQSVGRVYSELWRQAGYAILVIIGALIGSAYGLRGVAVGVGIAILYMFFATGQLALQILDTPWREYLRVQRDAMLIAALTGGAAMLARSALERASAPAVVIAAGTILVAGVPWAAGLIWKLGAPEFESLRPHLPGTLRKIVAKRPSFLPQR